VSAARSQICEERGAIALNGAAGIGLRKAKVQGVASIDAGVSTLASREAVNQPGIFLEAFCLEDFDL
jgi:hypothetical protein